MAENKKQTTQSTGEGSVSGQQSTGATINVTDTSAGEPTSQTTEKSSGAGPIWNSLKPGPAFTGALTPSASTPGATTPGIFSFDEPFGEVATTAVDPAALRAKIDHVHDGGLEGGFHHGDDIDHE